MQSKFKTLAIIICRTGSKRLKNKIFLKINKKTILELIYEKLSICKNIDKIIIATSSKKNDDIIARFAKNKDIDCIRGSEKNVLSRISKAQKHYKEYNIIVRANADCPLFVPKILDFDINRLAKSKFDLLSPFYKNDIPFGFSFVVFKSKTILKISKLARKKVHKEHVENYCFDNDKRFKIHPCKYDKKLHAPNIKLTLDTKKDYLKIKKIFKILKLTYKETKPNQIINFYKKEFNEK